MVDIIDQLILSPRHAYTWFSNVTCMFVSIDVTQTGCITYRLTLLWMFPGLDGVVLNRIYFHN